MAFKHFFPPFTSPILTWASLAFIILFLSSHLLTESRTLSNTNSLNNIGFPVELMGSHKGHVVQGLHKIKHYLQAYGYLPHQSFADAKTAADSNYAFDEQLEQAIKVYQLNHNLPVTGALDVGTMVMMSKPRCGVPDIIDGKTRMRVGMEGLDVIGSPNNLTISLYKLIYSNGVALKWPNGLRDLKYGLIGTSVFNKTATQSTVENAFSTWSKVVQKYGFKFSQELNNPTTARLTLGFFPINHGDGYPFPRGTHAHAFPPTDGRCHFNLQNRWTIGQAKNKVDFYSVAIHEIGHLLGLGHSSDTSAIMYPYLNPGEVKTKLTQDDIDGVTKLYK